jgi:hypothetical protein
VVVLHVHFILVDVAGPSVHGGRGTRYGDKDKVYMEYDHLTHNDAQIVKKLLAEKWGDG